MRNEYTDDITAAKLFKVFKMWYADNMGRSCSYSMRVFKNELAETLGLANGQALEVRRNSGRYLAITINLETKETYGKYV